jgi:DNA adenine methylase
MAWKRACCAGCRMSASVSRWLSVIELLPEIHVRWRSVQVEHDDYATILERYDTPETLFYCDPPYVPRTRRRGGYRHEMRHEDHEEMVRRLLDLEGKVILSGYADPVYEPLEVHGWERMDIPIQACAVGHTRKTGLIGTGSSKERQARVESIWLSPTALSTRQLTFGDLERGAGLGLAGK